MSAMVGEAMDHMAKYLRYGKKDVYSPVITKFEWDGHDNAYWAFYGKEIAFGYSSRRMLFAVCGRSFDDVRDKFVKLYMDYEAEGYIRDKRWYGPAPHTFNFADNKCDHSLIE